MNLDTLYNDFTTKLLPSIQEGLVISKEYFTDLFGRYAEFLFVTDILWVFVFLFATIASLVPLVFLISYLKKGGAPEIFFAITLNVAFTALFLGATINHTVDAIKAKYIPEVRVYEEITRQKNN